LKAIVRELDICGCREQPAKQTSVRTIASAPRAYDSITMNVTLKPFDFAQAVARAGLSTNGQPLQKSNAVEGAGFQQALTQALGAVSKSQNDATAMQREVQLDNPTVSIEQTMIAMQKAQIGFQATLQVRNKMVQAYSDIMSMQV
jgi:flagellar hook-basal body complex protein FliE